MKCYYPYFEGFYHAGLLPGDLESVINPDTNKYHIAIPKYIILNKKVKERVTAQSLPLKICFNNNDEIMEFREFYKLFLNSHYASACLSERIEFDVTVITVEKSVYGQL